MHRELRPFSNSQWLIIALTCAAFAVRLWQFGSYPTGLLPDELSSGYEAYAILNYGIDRNNVPYPAHHISWGGGQNVLYTYWAIPFIQNLGLTPFATRLPMLFGSLVVLPLGWWVMKRTFNPHAANTFAFILCFSPWHFMLSRWALESNLLPTLFLLGYAFLLKFIHQPRWLIASLVAFALSLYAYGTAYLVVPLFLLGSIFIFRQLLRLHITLGITSVSLAIVISLPIALFIITNSFKLNSMTLGFMGIPRMASPPRYEAITALSSFNLGETLRSNTEKLATILWQQTDGQVWSVPPNVGFAYGAPTTLLALAGLVLKLCRICAA